GDLAADDEHAGGVGLDLVGAEEVREPPLVGVVEDALDDGLLGAGADGLGRGALAEDELERAEEDALAGSGLARDDVEPAVELDFELFDQRVIADVEAAEHRAFAGWRVGREFTTPQVRPPRPGAAGRPRTTAARASRRARRRTP